LEGVGGGCKTKVSILPIAKLCQIRRGVYIVIFAKIYRRLRFGYFEKVRTKYYTWIGKFALRLNGVNFGKGLGIHGSVFIKNYGTIEIGNYVTIISAEWANPIGSGRKTFFQIFSDGKLCIGNNVGMSNIAITCANDIQIGNNVMIGSGCRIYDTDFHSIAPSTRIGPMRDDTKARNKPIIIEDYAFIGADTCILKGSKIGFASVIGASSVVSGNVPPMQIWAGNPARFIRDLTDEEMKGMPKRISL
jgi:acetyltransferase-like isoleucine patch superfamily enzyme